MFNHLLLCTHGSNGALKAEKYVFDDWLNTSKTRDTFLDHVSDQLAAEIDQDWQRIRETYPGADSARFLRVMGPVEETIARVAAEQACDLIVIGPYQKKHSKGLKARMQNKTLHPLLPVPLMVVP